MPRTRGAAVLLALLACAALAAAPPEAPSKDESGMVRVYYGRPGSNDYLLGKAPEPRPADAWTTWGSMQTALMDHMAVTSSTKQYVIGGYTSGFGLYENDLVSRTWTTRASMPMDICTGGAALVGDTIYVCGGYTASMGTAVDTLLKYSITGNNWTAAPGPYASGNFSWSPTVVACAGKVYFISGCAAPGATNPTTQVWAYTPGTGWASVASLNQGRVFAHAFVYHDTIWLAGGYQNTTMLTHTEFYSPVSNTWTVNNTIFPQLPTSRWAGGTATVAAGNKGIIYCGVDPAAALYNNVAVFDFTTRSWSTVPANAAQYVYRTAATGNSLDEAICWGGSTGGFTPSTLSSYETYAPPVNLDATVNAIVRPRGMEVGGAITPQAYVKNIGLLATGAFSVRMTIGGSYDQTQSVSSLAPGDSALVTFANWNATSGTYAVKCSTRLTGDLRTINDARSSQTIVVDYYEPFEPDDGGFSAGAPNQWQWGDPNFSSGPEANSSPNCWGTNLTGYYDNNANWWLTSCEYIANSANPTLLFNQWLYSENYWDGGNVSYSTNGGSTWTVLTGLTPGYMGVPVGLSPDSGWMGSVRPWTLTTGTIPVAANAHFWLRWRFGSDASVNSYPGWYVDDVAGLGFVPYTVATDVGVSAIVSPAGLISQRTGPTVTPQALVRNFGTLAQTNIPVACTIFGTGNVVRYTSTANVAALAPDSSVLVSFSPDWTPAQGESIYTHAVTSLSGDLNPANDLKVAGALVVRAYFTGGPDAENLAWIDSDTTGGPTYNWIDITTTGTPVPISGDDAVGSVPIGFTFQYRGNAFTSINANTNGLLNFGTGSTAYSNYDLPNASAPPNAVALFWDDMYCPSVGNIRYQTFGTTPNCTLVISYDNVRFLGSSQASLKFQALLMEGTNEIVFQYNDVDDGYSYADYGNAATVGCQNSTGTVGLRYLYGTGSGSPLPSAGNLLSAGRAIRFYPPYTDVGVVGIIRPLDIELPSTPVPVQIAVENFGDLGATFDVFATIAGSIDTFVSSRTGCVLGAGETDTFTLAGVWVPISGTYFMTCSTSYSYDRDPANDTASKTIVIRSSPPPPGGWSEIAQVPLTPSGKLVKDGGMVSYDASTGELFVLKGYKTQDFYRYNIGTNTWLTLPSMPLGTEAKPPYKGANICPDGNGTFYATKGNNTSGFYKYTVTDSTWTQLGDVPLGLSNKKVKGGTDMVYVLDDTTEYVYLLKGYKCEFYRYNVAAATWETLAEAPIGAKAKYDKGSWLAYDEPNRKIYAHKAKYMEMYTYSLDSMTWSAMMPGMPLANGQTGKNKKAKDGSDAVMWDGQIWTLKGGNTIDFYAYDLATATWAEKETIPSVGTTGKKKRVKAGSGLTTDGDGLYALKGNKTAEMWTYRIGTAYAPAPVRSGVMAERTLGRVGTVLGPNPLSTGYATLRYVLPKAGPATLRVYDVTGRTVTSQSLVAGRSGTASLDLRSLSAGVYLVKLTSDGYESTHKLVVER